MIVLRGIGNALVILAGAAVFLTFVVPVTPVLFAGEAWYQWALLPFAVAFGLLAVIATGGAILYGAWEYLLRPIVRALVRDALRDDLPR